MSYRINTNISAMNALRNLSNSNLEFSKSITRLSTGLRINSAADDPAGLIISEKFRTQIGGFDAAIRNSQDANNYAKTAEGALDEVNKLLADARSLAVASGNSGALSDAQKQANQSQLNSIVASISRIATQTAFGSKNLLDGSSGTYAASTSATNVSGISFSGNFNGSAITTNSVITVAVTTAGTRASVVGTRTFAFGTTTIGASAGAFSINGVSFTAATTDTIQDVVARINNVSTQTGVTATYATGGAVTLTSKGYGTNATSNLIDSSGVLLSAAGTLSSTGVDAIGDVIIDTNGVTAGGLATVTFNKGTGLNLKDQYGNTISLTDNGNLAAGNNAWGQINVGNSIFQIGGNAGQTASLSLGNFASSNLGLNAVAGKNLSNLDLTTLQGATDAITVIDKAVSDVASARGDVGSFQRNVLDSNIRSLGVSRENLAAAESSIRDIDVAEEMTRFTKLQILQQSGLAVLAQANSAPQGVLSLLR